MDPSEMCGNDLRFLLAWLHHHGDPRYNQLIKNLAEVTQGMVQIVVSNQITNQKLGQEFLSDSAKSFTAAAGKLAAVKQIAVAA
jgi:hypothetical protein